MEIKYLIEALLFASGEAVKLKEIAKVLECDVEDLYPVILELKDEYDEKKRGIKILLTKDTAKMVSNEKYYPYIKELLNAPEGNHLSTAALETLAIVAYRQPVTRPDIEQIRGVQSTSSLDTLIARGLITGIGRLDLPGKPIGYVTTSEFLQFMQIEDISELPKFENFSTVNMEE